MAATEERRAFFVESLMRFIIQFDFDGVDINWSYPSNRNGLIEDKENFVKLLKMLNFELKKRGRLLMAAVSATQNIIRTAYNIQEMCKYVVHIPH